MNIPRFADEFDVIPLPNEVEAKTKALVCNHTNVNYIRSNLAMPPLNLDSFFQQMAKHQWRAPFVKRDGIRSHVAKGFLAIGARRDLGANPMMVDRSKPLYGKHATDWDLIPELQRVNAYSFRGDKRPPRDIKAAGGFHPPSTRTDAGYFNAIAEKFVNYMKTRFDQAVEKDDVVNYLKGQGQAGISFVEYEIWRAILKSEELHIGKMVTDEFLKGYISTSRNVFSAIGFTTRGEPKPEVAVYAVHTEGGFLLPSGGSHAHGTTAMEAEIAHPGSLLWTKVMGFRTITTVDYNDTRTFEKSKVLFIRKGFREKDSVGAQQVIWALASVGV